MPRAFLTCDRACTRCAYTTQVAGITTTPCACPAIGKKKAKPRTQNTAEEKKAKPLYSTELKPVLMFTKTELRESAAQIKGIGPQRTEKIWRMMPFSSAFHEADDWEVEYILMKLVELKGLDCKHFYMEEHKHNQALADVHLAAMLAQSQAMLAHRRRAQTAQTAALILPQGV